MTQKVATGGELCCRQPQKGIEKDVIGFLKKITKYSLEIVGVIVTLTMIALVRVLLKEGYRLEIYGVTVGIIVLVALSWVFRAWWEKRNNSQNSSEQDKPLVNKVTNNSSKITIAVIVLSALGLFYWFEVRPTRIKHDCSWVRKYRQAIPERPAMSEDELSLKGMLEDCDRYKSVDSNNDTDSEKNNGIFEFSDWDAELMAACHDRNRVVIEDYRTIKPEEPAQEWYEKATKKEYDFCLHDKGL